MPLRMRPNAARTTMGSFVHLVSRCTGTNEHGHLYLNLLITPISNMPMPTPLSEQFYDNSVNEELDPSPSLEDRLKVGRTVCHTLQY